MTVSQFLIAKLSTLHIAIEAAEAAALLAEQGLSDTAEYGADNARAVKLAIATLLPTMLMKPDVSEGGYSEKWDKNALKLYYSILCRELGIDDVIAAAEAVPVPTVQDRSDLW